MKLYESIKRLDDDIEFYRNDNEKKLREISLLEKKLSSSNEEIYQSNIDKDDIEGLELICQIKNERIKYLKSILQKWHSLIEATDESF